jgi:serine/threonine-protein kinase
VDVPAPAPTRAAVVGATSVPAMPAAATPSAPKADCDPPFYFEGVKKVFKANCL